MEVSYESDWTWCVSTATSLLSTNWKEHFFLTFDDAQTFIRKAKKKGLVCILVNQEEY